jgi:adenylylsulfate kinase
MVTKDLKYRSLVKSISYRIFGTLVTLSVVYVVTGKISLGLAAGGLDLVTKIFLYYGHERIWDSIRWGRRESVSAVIWFTGLSGAGKSAIANLLNEELKSQGYTPESLDGDQVREILKDIGFGRQERLRHLHAMAFIASKLEHQGSIVIGSFITPYKEARDNLRKTCKNYIEVWVDTPLAECEKRDIKGLYKKARSGEIASFTGISDNFDIPDHYDIRIETVGKTERESLHDLMVELKKKLPDLKVAD